MSATPFQPHHGPEIDAKRAAKLEDVRRHAPRHVGTFQRAFEGKSLRAAVKANCVDCMGYDAGAVAGCSAVTCPLWLQRPGRRRNA